MSKSIITAGSGGSEKITILNNMPLNSDGKIGDIVIVAKENGGLYYKQYESDLPDDYYELEYLESTTKSNCWCDLGLTGRQFSGFEFKFLNPTTESWETVIGMKDNDAKFEFRNYGSTSNSYRISANGASLGIFSIDAATTPVTVSLNKGYLIINGSQQATYTYNGYAWDNTSTSYSLCIGRSNNAGECFKGRTYYIKIFVDGDTVLKELVPALRLSDNIAGWYDKKSKNFYKSVTTNWVAGPTLGWIKI